MQLDYNKSVIYERIYRKKKVMYSPIPNLRYLFIHFLITPITYTFIQGVRSHCVESYAGEEVAAVNCEKNAIFPEHPVIDDIYFSDKKNATIKLVFLEHDWYYLPGRSS